MAAKFERQSTPQVKVGNIFLETPPKREGNNSTWEISSTREKQITNYSMIDLPMTIVTRGGKQLNEFIDITTKFLSLNDAQKKYIKILPSLCREIEMLTKTKKRLKLIEDQNPDPSEWTEHFDGHILSNE